ncbi:unnamed protein product [Adineta steineri]|uniref:Seven cysteines N-terminal domain-containing protein n=1 Tax=Adineta steineri TaxID=433720 RepID=A0A815EHC0_9BILA|nr:unnamed protein product [Adineta steineri]CAF3685409.1 unnamed protein product [Adineta steineri]
MKSFVLFLAVLISSVELRRYDNNLYDLEDLLTNKYEEYKHRPDPQYNADEGDEVPDYSASLQDKKIYPSNEKLLPENDYVEEESESYDTTTKVIPSKKTKSTTTATTTLAIDPKDSSDASTCVAKYDIKPEQLVKVKELTNGARMIRYVLIDKRTLPFNVKVKDSCMQECCKEKTCDLAMLSEQPTHDGYKCYLFACNGSCILASHQDYTVMMYNKSSTIVKNNAILTSTMIDNNYSNKRSFFRETSVILFLVFGIICTIILFVLLFCHCRDSRKRGRRLKNYSVDEDYLINGLYM